VFSKNLSDQITHSILSPQDSHQTSDHFKICFRADSTSEYLNLVGDGCGVGGLGLGVGGGLRVGVGGWGWGWLYHMCL